MNNFLESKKKLQGDKAETLFVQLIQQIKPTAIITSATTEQNRVEHWDISVDAVTYDVKDEKNLGLTNSYQVLEIFDWRGKLGWLYGEADFIAFKSGSSFILTSRKELVKYHLNNTKDEKCGVLSEAINKTYTRNNKDLITIFCLNDVLRHSYILYNKDSKIGMIQGKELDDFILSDEQKLQMWYKYYEENNDIDSRY